MSRAQPRSTEAQPPFDFATALQRAKEGDEAARSSLFARIYPRVEVMVHTTLERKLRASRPWLAARFSTGDVVHEVFRNLLEDMSTFHGDSEDALCAYVSGIVRNRLIDAIRFHEAARRDGRRTSQTREDVDPRSERVGPGTSVASAEELRRFREVMGTMPEQDQLLLRERLEGGLGFRELAELLGFSSKWAARRAFYAAQTTLSIRLGQEPESGQ